MATVGLKLIIDSEGNVQGVEQVEEGLDRLESNARKAQREIAKVGAAADKLANSAIVMGGAGMAAAYGMVQATSNLAEAQNKSNEVFGESVDVVNEFADQGAQALGMSRRAALQAAGGFGVLFQSMEPDKAAEMSTEMVALARDMASFNDISVEEAMEKLRAGLVGEAEPLRTVGVLLDEASVKAKGMEMGLADANGELSQGAKVQARYALILEQTAQQQGDFARTADGVANSQRAATGAMEDAAAIAGGALTESYQAVMAALLPVIEGTAEFAATPAGQTAIQVAAGLSAIALAAGAAYKGIVAIKEISAAAHLVIDFMRGRVVANTAAMQAETAALGTNTAAANANAAAHGRAGAARGAGGAAAAGAPKPASSAGTKLLGAGAIVAGVAYAGHLQKQQVGQWQQGYEEAGGGLGGVAGAWKRGMGWTYDKATDLLAPEMGGYNPARMVHDRYIRPRVEAWSGYSDEETVPAERAPVQAQPVQIPRSTMGGLPGPTQIPTRATSGGGVDRIVIEHRAGDAMAAQLARSPEVQSMAERVVERRMRQ